jgi:hypothetical protein
VPGDALAHLPDDPEMLAAAIDASSRACFGEKPFLTIGFSDFCSRNNKAKKGTAASNIEGGAKRVLSAGPIDRRRAS